MPQTKSRDFRPNSLDYHLDAFHSSKKQPGANHNHGRSVEVREKEDRLWYRARQPRGS